jgi:hypothetical protein
MVRVRTIYNDRTIESDTRLFLKLFLLGSYIKYLPFLLGPHVQNQAGPGNGQQGPNGVHNAGPQGGGMGY